MSKQPPEISRAVEREALTPDGFDAWLAEKGMAWQKLDRGEYEVSLNDAKLLYVMKDPVRFARAFMDEPETGEPYTFWEYQEPSVRSYRQDVIHQDGAEVGKTREIIALILWGMCTGFGWSIKKPDILVAAPQQTHLDEIIMALEAHMGVADGSSGEVPFIQRFWLRPKKHPHYMAKFKGPTCPGNNVSRVYFRPAGHDGEAFRGVHVNRLGLMDEAAKITNPVCWSEFNRALMPAANRRIYSVPNGDNATEFYRMTQQAEPDLPEGKDGLRLFRWSKDMMPPPFWTPKRERHFVRLYGSRSAPGYVRNVKGLHGQQENPVWPWETIEPNLRDVPDYRALKLTVDAENNQLNVLVYRVELKHIDGKKKHGQEHYIVDRAEDLKPFQDPKHRRQAVRELLREFITPICNAALWAGADLGFSKDPTEIFLNQEIGAELHDRVRIHASGVSYDIQSELIYCLDELFNWQAEWGVDFGSAGTAVVQQLQGSEIYQDGHYDERMTGFQFAAALDAIDEHGNKLTETDKNGDEKPVRLPAKELATNLITARLQRNGYAWAYDTEVVNHHSNHTAREGQRNRIFAKQDDHTIDARRVMELRRVFSGEYAGDDVFSSGVNVRSAA